METEKLDIQINPGMILQIGAALWRILTIVQQITIMCEMGTSKLHLYSMPVIDVYIGIVEKTILIIPPKEQKVFRIEQLSPSLQNDYIKKQEIIHKIENAYGPTFLELKDPAQKEALNQCIETSGYTRATVLKTVRNYLQSGRNPLSLLDGRITASHSGPSQYKKKTGRPALLYTGIIVDDTVAQHFDEAIEDFLNNRAESLSGAYEKMLNVHYSVAQETSEGGRRFSRLPDDEIPTFRQFSYYFHKKVSSEQLDAAKTSKREQRNNKRLLLSDNLNNVRGPGDLVEIDECEANVSLISRINRKQVIGRPIVYILIDVFTRLIIGYSVSFSNNSVQGLTNCLLSLLPDKVQLCKKFGLIIESNEWPSKILPNRLRSDYGSEYRSKEAERIFLELGITRELVSPGSGSLKGVVEQFFNELEKAVDAVLYDLGLIEKRFDSRHHETAVLTIDDYEAVLLSVIVSHNRKYMKDYHRTIEAVNADILPIPYKLWEYGCQQYGSPKQISDENQYLYSLLTPVKASYNKRGITYNNLYYSNDDPDLLSKMYNTGQKKVALESARIDVRDIGTLYYINLQGKLDHADLNLNFVGNDFRGYTLDEYKEFKKYKSVQDRAGKSYELSRKVELRSQLEQCVSVAEQRKSGPNNTKDIAEARRSEKHDKAQDYCIQNYLPAEYSSDALTDTPTEEKVECGETQKKSLESIQAEEFLNELQKYEKF